MDDPRYGTEPPERIPVLKHGDHTTARLMAGTMINHDGDVVTGPFQTVQDVQMVDYTVFGGDTVNHEVPLQLDNTLIYVYSGQGTINGHDIEAHDCIRLDASDANKRGVSISAERGGGLAAIMFSGKMLKQPIAWHGPFVMTTNKEIRDTIAEYRAGTFLKKRADWDYKRIATKPNA